MKEEKEEPIFFCPSFETSICSSMNGAVSTYATQFLNTHKVILASSYRLAHVHNTVIRSRDFTAGFLLSHRCKVAAGEGASVWRAQTEEMRERYNIVIVTKTHRNDKDLAWLRCNQRLPNTSKSCAHLCYLTTARHSFAPHLLSISHPSQHTAHS